MERILELTRGGVCVLFSLGLPFASIVVLCIIIYIWRAPSREDGGSLGHSSQLELDECVVSCATTLQQSVSRAISHQLPKKFQSFKVNGGFGICLLSHLNYLMALRPVAETRLSHLNCFAENYFFHQRELRLHIFQES